MVFKTNSRNLQCQESLYFYFCSSKYGGGGGLVTKSCLTLVTPWTIACQAPLSMRFSWQEYWSGWPFSSLGDFSNPGIEPGSPALLADSLPLSHWEVRLYLIGYVCAVQEPGGKYVHEHIPGDNSVQFSCSVVSNSLWPHEPQHTRPTCPSWTPGVYPNSSPLSQWCHLTISSSVVPCSSCLQSFPIPGSFQTSVLSTLGGQNTGVSASASVRPVNTQDWFPLGWPG